VFGILTLSFINYIDKTMGASDDESELALEETDSLSEDSEDEDIEFDSATEDDIDNPDEASDEDINDFDDLDEASDEEIDGLDDLDEASDDEIDDLDEASDNGIPGGIGSEYGDYTVTDILPAGDQIIDTSGLVYEVTGGEGIITVSGGSTVLILNGTDRSGLTSQLRVQGNANVTLYLVKGTVNSFSCTGTGTQPNDNQAGIQVDPDAVLSIKGHGTLNATGGTYSAGIGGFFTNGSFGSPGAAKSGTITIQSGTVTAIGGSYAAGIGGGNKGPGGTTKINGGKVKAIGGDNGGAGIGGGGLSGTVRAGSQGSTGGAIYITGGQVTAWAYDNSAGIGGGAWSDGGYIEISGGNIEAISSGGAGIGAGKNSKCGFIEISAGTVYAEGGLQAAGIGNDADMTGGRIIITGGIIHAKSNDASASGIGGGENGSATIEISGGSVLSIGPRTIDKAIKDMIRINCDPTSGFDDRNLYFSKIKLINENNSVLPGATITVSVSGRAPNVPYVYSATSNKDGMAYLWLPNGTHDILIYNPDNGSYFDDNITVNIPLDTVQYDPDDAITVLKMSTGLPQWSLNASPLNFKVYDETVKLTVNIESHESGVYLNSSVADVKWYRESIESTENTDESFDSGYAAAVSGNKGVGGSGSKLNLINGNNLSERQYAMDIDQNGRYWVQVHFICAADGKDVYLAEYIDIDNIYTPTDVYVRDWNVNDNIEIKPYTEITLPGDTLYGIPFDLDGSEILAAPSLGYDTVVYKHNAELPVNDWDMNVPEDTFEATAPDAKYSLIKLGQLVDVNEDNTPNSDETTKYYTVTYALIVNDILDLSTITNTNNTSYTVEGAMDPYVPEKSPITSPLGTLIFKPGANGKAFRIMQSLTPNNPTANKEPKYGSTYIKHIIVNDGADITLVLDSIHLIGNITLEDGAAVTIKLDGVSYIRSSILVPEGAALVIDSFNGSNTTDRLVMPLQLGIINNRNARIGGFGKYSLSDTGEFGEIITITNENSGTITINGGGIDIDANTHGAVIGGGGGYSIANNNSLYTVGGNGTVTINGGIISLTQRGCSYANDNKDNYGGACIGGGGAGAGGGHAENVKITGGTITLKQYTRGAGIGGGAFGGAGNIEITGGDIDYKAIREFTVGGGGEGAGIGTGSGNNDGAGSITISGGTINIDAYTTGIGRVHILAGSLPIPLDINISGGDINTKGNVGPGIGYYSDSRGSKITITGGNIIAEGKTFTAIGCSTNNNDVIFELGAAANVRAYAGGTTFPAINVISIVNSAYYVNASLTAAIAPTTAPSTLLVYENGKSDKLLKTLTLPANYRHFAYSTNLNASRTDNVLVQSGANIVGQIYRNSDSNTDIYSVNTLNGYSAHKGAYGALPVKYIANNSWWIVTEKYVDIDGNTIPNTTDNLFKVEKGKAYNSSIPSPEDLGLTELTARGYRLDSLTNTLITSSTVTIDPVNSNRIVYFVYQVPMATTLTISAEVWGEYSDKSKEFKFWVYFVDATDNELSSGATFSATRLSQGNATPEPVTLTIEQHDNTTAAPFMLKNGQSIVIQGVNLDYKVRIVEDAPASLYDVIFRDSNESDDEDGCDTGLDTEYMRQIVSSHSFHFRNERVVNVPVGINSGNMEAILLMAKLVFMATICVAILTLYIRRRQVNN